MCEIICSKKVLGVVFGVVLFGLSASVSFAQNISMPGGTTFPQNTATSTITYLDTWNEAYTAVHQHSLYSVTTNNRLCNNDGVWNSTVPIGNGGCSLINFASTTGTYSFIINFDGDVTCETGNSYTACVTATFVDEVIFTITTTTIMGTTTAEIGLLDAPQLMLSLISAISGILAWLGIRKKYG